MNEIKDGLYVYVGGTVEEVRHAKTGLAATVSVQREGAKYPDRITVWDIGNGISQGDRIKLKGWLSWARNEAANGKTYFNVSVNKPEILSVEKPLTVDKVAADILGAELVDESAPF